ncbi:MAG: GntR family transcriptional regulator [Clostridia bacterium]|nr:GntR family transcriptional regulator [Clostridia bacterium]
MNANMLVNESASPLYRQLMERLRDDIAGGVYPPHSRIPSETELCQTYRVSRVTVRKALAELTREGLLRRMQGKGTFVCAPRISQSLRDVISFHEACRLTGRTPGTRLISARMTTPDATVRADLGLSPEGQCVEITRLRTADGEPVMLETNCFGPGCSWLLDADLDGSLYTLLEARGMLPTRGIHEISLCYATPAQARLLGVNAGDALLMLNQIIFNQNGSPLHTSCQVIRGDRFTFRI